MVNSSRSLQNYVNYGNLYRCEQKVSKKLKTDFIQEDRKR